MTSCDAPEWAAIDDYIRAQLAKASQTYASKADLDAMLKEALETDKAEG